MTDGESLFRAIRETPDDDAPRLIYADWLDENGEEDRAEFIRIQCQLARIPIGSTAGRRLHQRCQELQEHHLSAWKAPFAGLCWASDFRRGFADTVQLTHRQFIDHSEQLQTLAPFRLWCIRPQTLFRHVHEGPTLRDVVQHPTFAFVRDIEVGHYSANELLTEMADSPNRTGLRGITISHSHASDRELRLFFESVPALCEVTATRTNVKSLAFVWRKGSHHRWKRLELVASRATNDVLAGMAASPALATVESLWLDDNPFDDRGLAALCESDYLRNVCELSLANASLGNEGAIRLARSPIVTNIRVLNLSGCGIDAAGCQALADSPYLQHLELLCLDRNRVSLSVEHELVTRFGLKALSFGW